MPDPDFAIEPTRVLDGRSTANSARDRSYARHVLPGTVLFGNSFSDYYWTLGLHRYFCFIRRARNPISRFKSFYETMPAETKYFIFQFYEPWLVLDTPPLK